MHKAYLGSIGKEWGSEMGRNPINGVKTSRLSLWATEAQLNWGILGDSVACALEVSPHQSQPQEMRKQGTYSPTLVSHWLRATCWGTSWGHYQVPPRFSLREGLVAQLQGVLSVDNLPLSTHSVIALGAGSCLAKVTSFHGGPYLMMIEVGI